MEDSNLQLMGSAPVSRAILKLSIPTVLSTIISIIYNLTNTYFIGLLDDPIQLGAISLAFPVFMVINEMELFNGMCYTIQEQPRDKSGIDRSL